VNCCCWCSADEGQQSGDNAPEKAPWDQVERDLDILIYTERFHDQLSGDVSPHVVDGVFPGHRTASSNLYHGVNLTLAALERDKKGRTFLLRNTRDGDHRLVFAGTNDEEILTGNQYLRKNVEGLPPRRREAKSKIASVYASTSVSGALLHTASKGTGDNLLIVVIGTGCAAHAGFHSWRDNGIVRNKDQGVLLLDVNGDPGPGLLILESRDKWKTIRLVHDTLLA